MVTERHCFLIKTGNIWENKKDDSNSHSRKTGPSNLMGDYLKHTLAFIFKHHKEEEIRKLKLILNH